MAVTYVFPPYVTVHAKTSTKIEINFFTPGYSYLH